MHKLEKGQSQSPGKKCNRIQISVPMCLFTGVQSVVHVVPVNPDPARPPSPCQNPHKQEGSFPVTPLTALQQFRKLPPPRLLSSAVAALVSSGFPQWSDWFSQQFYLPLLARPLLILWHYDHMILVICFATWRAGKKEICGGFASCRLVAASSEAWVGTFHIQHHARERNTVDQAFYLGGPRLDGLTGLWPQNGLGPWLDVAHDLEAHGWDQLQHTRDPSSDGQAWKCAGHFSEAASIKITAALPYFSPAHPDSTRCHSWVPPVRSPPPVLTSSRLHRPGPTWTGLALRS